MTIKLHHYQITGEIVRRSDPVVYYRSVGTARTRIPTSGHLLQVSSRLIERTRLLRALRIIS